MQESKSAAAEAAALVNEMDATAIGGGGGEDEGALVSSPPASARAQAKTQPGRGTSAPARGGGKPAIRLDLRFADDEDCEDILAVVNAALAHEVGATGAAFRRESALGQEKYLADDTSMTTRWCVLETPVPEEDVVAAGRLHMEHEGTGEIDLLCVHPDQQRKGIGSYLMKKLENIILANGCHTCRLTVAQWSQDALAPWLARLGYEECGGEMWPDEEVTRPTMRITFEKRFRTTNAPQRPAPLHSGQPQPSSSSSSSEAGSSSSGNGGSEDSMLGLMGDLMSSLRAAGASLDAIPAAPLETDGNSAPDEFSATPPQPPASTIVDDMELQAEEVVVDASTTSASDGSSGIEGLLGHLLQELNTDAGRADFQDLLARSDDADNLAAGSSNQESSS